MNRRHKFMAILVDLGVRSSGPFEILFHIAMGEEDTSPCFLLRGSFRLLR